MLKNAELRRIITYDQPKEICGKKFWTKKFPQEDCFQKYLLSLNAIKETKLKVLSFKIFHNIFPTRILLKKFNLVDSELCMCGQKDFIEHALVECSLLAAFLKDITIVIQQIINKKYCAIDR